MTGTIRVTSKRAGGLKPLPNELVIEIDRCNPVLGNPHVLRDHRDAVERLRVVAAYGLDLKADFARRGPKFLACVAIADKILAGQNIALHCWCKLLVKEVPCHGDLLRDEILPLAGIPLPKKEAQLELLAE